MARRIQNDAEIAKAVAKALEENALVPHERIKVSVHNGWLTLEGMSIGCTKRHSRKGRPQPERREGCVKLDYGWRPVDSD